MTLIDPGAILPAVLAGGKSRRFGHDKLQEPLAVPASFLIDAPIGALRQVFGRRVALVGPCDPAVRARADAHIDDLYPGAGPAGGIASALAAAIDRGRAAVFILAGDLPAMTADAIRTVLEVASAHPDAPAVVATTDRPQPCIALYRAGALDAVRLAAASGRPLREAIQSLAPISAPIDPRAAVNINAPRDLDAFRAAP